MANLKRLSRITQCTIAYLPRPRWLPSARTTPERHPCSDNILNLTPRVSFDKVPSIEAACISGSSREVGMASFHRLEPCPLNRRQFLRYSAGTGLALGLGPSLPALAQQQGALIDPEKWTPE